MHKYILCAVCAGVSGLLLLLIISAARASEYPSQTSLNPLSWHLPSGALNDKGKALFDVLSHANEQGLEPDDYLAGADFGRGTDELLTVVALAYIRDLKVGRKTPRELDPALHISPPEIDVKGLLTSVYASEDVKEALESLAPIYPEYRLLKEKLTEYRQIEADGGWPKVPDGKTLQLGMEDPAVEVLSKRLMLQGYLERSQELTQVFNALLFDAVRDFQRHHGLDADGKVGRETRKALNVSVGDRIRQIILNMERWRWLPDNLGRKHMRVNIAGFYLRVFEDNRRVMEMPVIVGKPYRKTPVFSSVITDVTFHPYWHVPVIIAHLNVIPEIIKDKGYLIRQEFEVLKPGADGRFLIVERPESLPWITFQQNNFPFILRQKPGSRNALGHVRFNIRNDFGVYMHGTPDQDLFAGVVRARSSGCIRVADPLKLTKYMLRDNPSWRASRIDEVYFQFETINNPRPLNVPLEEPFPIHILYWTAWGEDDDHLHFRNDIYGRDEILAKSLF